MYLKVAKSVSFLVGLLIFLQIVGASLTTLSAALDNSLSLHSRKPVPSTLSTFVFEKAEEETEKTEKETDRIARLVLIDFSRAFSLSFYHTPQVQALAVTFQYDVRPPVHELNCVFLI